MIPGEVAAKASKNMRSRWREKAWKKSKRRRIVMKRAIKREKRGERENTRRNFVDNEAYTPPLPPSLPSSSSDLGNALQKQTFAAAPTTACGTDSESGKVKLYLQTHPSLPPALPPSPPLPRE